MVKLYKKTIYYLNYFEGLMTAEIEERGNAGTWIVLYYKTYRNNKRVMQTFLSCKMLNIAEENIEDEIMKLINIEYVKDRLKYLSDNKTA